jgi:hypothetical protein
MTVETRRWRCTCKEMSTALLGDVDGDALGPESESLGTVAAIQWDQTMVGGL